MNFQPIFFVIGLLLLALGSLMIAPAVFDFANGEPSWEAFAESAFLTLLFSALCIFANRPSGQIELSVRETFILTTGSWLALTVFASLPFILTTVTSSHTDSIFEAISALTTTGATVIVGLDYAPQGLLLWRALLQWLGGIGIIVMAMTVLPLLRIGGMQLFRSEFSDRSEKILPRVSQITKAIFWVYCAFTALCCFFLWTVGLNFFDALCHSMTTVSTGGMSNYDSSFAHFNNWAAELILIFFMVVGALPLIMYIRLLRGDLRGIRQDEQLRTYMLLIMIVPFMLILYRWYVDGVPFVSSLRYTYFNFMSAMTTTGVFNQDYDTWGSFAFVLIFAAIFIGGCTGSTAGGFKQFRLKIIYTLTSVQLYKQFRPHAVRVPTYNGQEITVPVILSVLTFLTLFFIIFGLLTLGLASTGLDFMTCVSASAACITSFGPGLGDLVGPKGSYVLLPDSAKWMLMFGMLLGRLEMITVLILFSPSFWRK